MIWVIIYDSPYRSLSKTQVRMQVPWPLPISPSIAENYLGKSEALKAIVWH